MHTKRDAHWIKGKAGNKFISERAKKPDQEKSLDPVF